jgi:hypothetical protein
VRSKALSLLAAAALLTGCALEFPETAWSPEEQARLRELQPQTDFDSRLELARLFFMHNRIDDADALLRSLVQEEPGDLEAVAWDAANRCKIAGRKGPWLLGFDKLYLVWDCLSDLDEAVKQAPDHFTVLLIQINTGAEVDMFGSLERAAANWEPLAKKIAKKPEDYTPTARAAFFEASANLEKARHQAGAERDYLQRIIALNADAGSVSRARERLAQLKAGEAR